MKFCRKNGSILIYALLPLLLTACSQKREPTKTAVAGNTVESDDPAIWKKRYDLNSRLVKSGMSAEEVVAAIGKPVEEQTIIGSNSYKFWLYDIGNRIKFQVMFDKDNKVTFSRPYM